MGPVSQSKPCLIIFMSCCISDRLEKHPAPADAAWL